LLSCGTLLVNRRNNLLHRSIRWCGFQCVIRKMTGHADIAGIRKRLCAFGQGRRAAA
jgi:hypothetical protein